MMTMYNEVAIDAVVQGASIKRVVDESYGEENPYMRSPEEKKRSEGETLKNLRSKWPVVTTRTLPSTGNQTRILVRYTNPTGQHTHHIETLGMSNLNTKQHHDNVAIGMINKMGHKGNQVSASLRRGQRLIHHPLGNIEGAVDGYVYVIDPSVKPRGNF